MILFKKTPITFEEKEYEIRVYYSDMLINVLIFCDNYPANGLRHQIKLSHKLPVKEILKKDIIDELIEISRNDIIEKRCERLMKNLHTGTETS